MGDRHYYDRKGNYRGRSSKYGPGDSVMLWVIIFIVGFVMYRGCR